MTQTQTAMKKSIILLSSLLLAAACSNDDCGPTQKGETVSIRISASVADNFTRADETVTADRCILEIYNADDTPYNAGKRYTAMADAAGKFNFEPSLLSGRSYRFVFWADKAGATADTDLHYDTSAGLRNINAITTDLTACDAEYDAFYAVADVVADKSQQVNATLSRAVCRLNVATGFIPAETGIHTVTATFADMPVAFDALTGTVSGSATAVSTAAVEITATGEQLQWYTYLFAPAEEGVRTVDFNLAATAPGSSDTEYEYAFSQIPVQRNYRVNVSAGTNAELGITLRAEP